MTMILCIEDEAHIREDIVEELQGAGYETAEAENGKEGLEATLNLKPDLVLCDITMPVMSGFDLLMVLRESHPEFADIPFVLLTALADRNNLIAGKQLGAEDYLTKPIDYELLLATVQARLEQVSRISSIKEREILKLNNAVEQASRTIRRLETKDPLTGLSNRIHFLDRFLEIQTEAIRGQSSLAIMLIDIDGLANVNDTLGYPTGNEILKTVAIRLRESIGVAECSDGCESAGDLVARLGDDEFAIILTDESDYSKVSHIAQRILFRISDPIFITGCKVPITVSIGSVVGSIVKTTVSALLKQANMALRHAKSEGCGVYRQYDPVWAKQAHIETSVVWDLRAALEQKEFLLHYQPRINAKGGEIVGAEALIRLWHPERGLVYPDDFISTAESSGLIIPIGEWVLRTACQQARAWQEEGLPPMGVAVNLSALQFKQAGIVETVSGILVETGLDPQWLELEITESLFLDDADSVIETMNRLHELGVGIAIDDFGTGYSSLSYLKWIPADIIKIDRSFVRDILIDQQDAAIAGAIIEVGHAHDSRIVAEGIETEEQRDFLEMIACNQFQGNYFSQPLPAVDFARFASGYAGGLDVGNFRRRKLPGERKAKRAGRVGG